MIKLYGLKMSNYYSLTKALLIEKSVEFEEVKRPPSQEEDFLAANPVLLDWGWEPGRDSIVFRNLGHLRVQLQRPVLL